jgi:hypothetical protein
VTALAIGEAAGPAGRRPSRALGGGVTALAVGEAAGPPAGVPPVLEAVA